MSIFYLLFFVFSLGAVATSDPVHNGSDVSDGSEMISQGFLSGIERIIARRDTEALRHHITEDFVFRTCKGEYGKYDIFSFIRSLPNNTKVSIDYLSSQWINENLDINTTVIVTGFFLPSFRGSFTLARTDVKYSLSKGMILDCYPVSRNFNAQTDTDGSEGETRNFIGNQSSPFLNGFETISRKLVSSIEQAVNHRDLETFGTFLSEKFVFRSCRGEDNKYDLYSLFRALKNNSTVSIDYVRSKLTNNNTEIECTVIVTGFLIPSFHATFKITKDGSNYFLTEGQILGCYPRQFQGRIIQTYKRSAVPSFFY